MTLTSMGCPMGPQIVANVKQELMELPEVKDVEVNIFGVHLGQEIICHAMQK